VRSVVLFLEVFIVMIREFLVAESAAK